MGGREGGRAGVEARAESGRREAHVVLGVIEGGELLGVCGELLSRCVLLRLRLLRILRLDMYVY
jgi:hypothetical protein